MLPSFHLEIQWLGITWLLSNVSEPSDSAQDEFYGATGSDPIDGDTPEAEIASDPEIPEHTLPLGFHVRGGGYDEEDV
jgi:hypothetical protein